MTHLLKPLPLRCRNHTALLFSLLSLNRSSHQRLQIISHPEIVTATELDLDIVRKHVDLLNPNATVHAGWSLAHLAVMSDKPEVRFISEC